MEKRDVAAVLREIADYLGLSEKNKFKARAYENAARSLESVELPMADFISSGAIGQTPGIGKATGSVIEELVREGKSKYLEQLRSEYPPGILDLIRVPGLSIKRVAQLYEELGISTLDDLERACSENKIAKLAGFGAKTQEKIVAGIEQARVRSVYFLLSKAARASDELLPRFEACPAAGEVRVAGALRRRLEVVESLDFLISTNNLRAARQQIREIAILDEFSGDAETLAAIYRAEIPVKIAIVPDDQAASQLLFATGSDDYVKFAVEQAAAKDLDLRPDGLFDGKNKIAAKDEKSLMKAIGVPWIEPELRESEHRALWQKKNPKLIQLGDLQGTFHIHSTYSDGRNTIDEMLRTAHGLGLAYAGISDHSKFAAYAGGLTEERLDHQHEEISRVEKGLKPMRVFRGTEADILQNGEIDYGSKTLSRFDFVVASVHNRFKASPDEMTERLVRALSNPFVTFLGHMTGRLLLSREGFVADFDRVFEAAAKNGVIIEINGSPRRLDIDWRLMQRALSYGVIFSIHPDAHSIEEMNYLLYGVWNARKGAMRPSDIFNTLPVEEVEDYLMKRRKRAIAATA